MPYDKTTAIHLDTALRNGDEAEVLRLIDVGNINSSIGAGFSTFIPLHAAACYAHPSLCRMLLELGADPNAKMDDGGLTPLLCVMHFSFGSGINEKCYQTFEMLLQAGADPNACAGSNNWTSLHQMVHMINIRQGSTISQMPGSMRDRQLAMKAIGLLLKKGADPAFVPEGGGDPDKYLTPFEYAAQKGVVGAVRLFLDSGLLDLGKKTAGGKTLFQLTKNAEIKEMIKSAKIEQGIGRAMQVAEAPSVSVRTAKLSPL